MEVAVNDAGCVLNKIKQLVGEFKGLHELLCLEHNASDNHTIFLQVSRRCLTHVGSGLRRRI